MDQVVFMDFEASALRDGYPVEVGWAWVEQSHVRADGMLIAPADEWLTPGFVWDPIAEAIHGLPLSRLRSDGVAPTKVCHALNQRLQDKTVVFDTGPDGLDRHWLDLLFMEGGQARQFKLGGPVGEILEVVASRNGLSEEQLTSLKKMAPASNHHAAQDAAYYAWCMAAMQRMAAQVKVGNMLDAIAEITICGDIRL
ncbi:MAG: hypothetical protein KG075_12570 [Alphaproteobacteria bacterium]|nr:hypothetical protein [Alphaproteobacteria bacterium]